jgi:hypothetical protein
VKTAHDSQIPAECLTADYGVDTLFEDLHRRAQFLLSYVLPTTWLTFASRHMVSMVLQKANYVNHHFAV